MSNTNSNISFLSLVSKSVKVPLQTSVTMASATLSLAEEFANNVDIVVDRVKGLGRAADAAALYIEAGVLAAVNSGLEPEKKLTIKGWENPQKRKEAIFSSINGEEILRDE